MQDDEDGVRLRAIHLVLRRREVGLEPAALWDVLEGIQDLLALGVFPVPELVVAEAEHDQALGPEALRQPVHVGVIPDPLASE